MGLTYDDYIRTTEERHREGVQKLFRVLQERGFSTKGSYTGQYCVSDELYVDAPPGSPCPDCGRITETVSEENYFFKLSAFERKLLELLRTTSRLHPARSQPQRSDFLRAQRIERSFREPDQLRLGNPGTRRRKARDLCLDGGAGQLHYRPGLRQRRTGAPAALRAVLAS